jgi:hypothetical protein
VVAVVRSAASIVYVVVREPLAVVFAVRLPASS